MTKRLVGIVIILLIAGGVGFKAWMMNHPDAFKDDTAVQQASSAVKSSATTTPEQTSTSVSSTSPTIDTERPIGGTRMGVVEVGASGFNAFVVEVDKQDNWELISKEFGASNMYEGFATFEDTNAGLVKYIANIFEKGVDKRNIHFVISSGAMKGEKTAMIAKAIKARGYVVNIVTAKQEGEYALRALLPKAYKSNSFVVDIGSGNTKISWYEGVALKSVECSGAKYYERSISDVVVDNEIKLAVDKVPSDHRENCFIIGGVPHVLAEQSRNGEERFTALAPPDEYNSGENVKTKSGLVIYKALIEGSGTSTFIFDWDANFTIGFLLNLN